MRPRSICCIDVTGVFYSIRVLDQPFISAWGWPDEPMNLVRMFLQYLMNGVP